jgi:hypothetical protein
VKNWQKLAKIGKNWRKLAKIDENLKIHSVNRSFSVLRL